MRPAGSWIELAVLFARRELVELHPGELAVLDDEADRREVLENLDLLFFRVLELPRRRLEVLARLARDHLHVGGAEALRRAAAIHRGVADADDQHALADRFDVPEVNRLEPLDADEDLIGLVPARQIELLAFRRAAADEHRVEFLRVDQRLQARDRRVVFHRDAHVHDVADLFVEHLFGEAEGGDVDAHQAARARPFLEDGALVTQRHQVVRHGEGGRTGADERHLLSVLLPSGSAGRRSVMSSL